MRKYDQACPVARTLDLVGDRWTLVVIRDMFMGLNRFADLRDHNPGMPPKILSARLKFLIEEGVLERKIYSEHPLRAEYHLTEKGRSLLPIILALGCWGLDNTFEDEPEARDAVARAIYDRIPEARPILVAGGLIDG
jgi:DNA-binding HxlR family transcriptional regulator